MNYFKAFQAQEAKLETEGYPITLTIRPNTTPEAQMALFDRATEGLSSRDAALVFQFLADEINVRVYGRLVISDALMGKIKGQAKKLLFLWLQADHAARVEQAGYRPDESCGAV